MNFVWFWSFWHWSKESFREGSLLRSPLQGLGGHWDEWLRHEASEAEQTAINRAGLTESLQRQFVDWLCNRWMPESGFQDSPQTQHFILHQLAQVQPFNQWAAFNPFRKNYGIGGVSAVVLTEKSTGEPEDVRPVEALALPADPSGPAIVAEEFQAGSFELETPRQAAMSMLNGKGFLVFLALWIASGQRPYPNWLKIVLALGWMAVGGLILYLLLGPDPEEQLSHLCAILFAVWAALVLTAVAIVAKVGVSAWLEGRKWHAQLDQSQIRLRMNGGLRVKGGSAGLAFCLNTILSLYRANNFLARHSWLWQRLFDRANRNADSWAATGVVTADGYLKPVVLEPKLRACLQKEEIKNILTPRQPGTARRALTRLAGALSIPAAHEAQLGFATEEPALHIHPCRHVAQVFMRLGAFTSARQLTLNIFACTVSMVMLLAVSDLREILVPAPAPMPVAPASPSPDSLWVNLDTKHPEYFYVELQSHFWLNRRSEVSVHTGPNGSVRAEIFMQRLASFGNRNPEDGVVWILRRQRFLGREFAPGECVGRYDLTYIQNIDNYE